MNHMLISLASNTDHAAQLLEEVIRMLEEAYPESRFSSIYPTDPVGRHTARKYYNGVALLYTELPFDLQKALFKKVESEYGRTPESRQTGIVPLDIDIVMWNDQTVKPADLQQTYLKRGLEEIGYPV